MYQRILIPVDGSETSDRGLEEAMALAARMGSRLRLVHVIDQPYTALGAEGIAVTGGDWIGLLRDGGLALLAEAKRKVQAKGLVVDTVMHEGLAGRVCDLVTQEARDWGAELIVIGTHGRRGAGRLLLGSDAEQILRLSPVPVLLVRGAAA